MSCDLYFKILIDIFTLKQCLMIQNFQKFDYLYLYHELKHMIMIKFKICIHI